MTSVQSDKTMLSPRFLAGSKMHTSVYPYRANIHNGRLEPMELAGLQNQHSNSNSPQLTGRNVPKAVVAHTSSYLNAASSPEVIPASYAYPADFQFFSPCRYLYKAYAQETDSYYIQHDPVYVEFRIM